MSIDRWRAIGRMVRDKNNIRRAGAGATSYGGGNATSLEERVEWRRQRDWPGGGGCGLA